MAYPLRSWFAAFVFTQVIEIPVYTLAIRHAVKTGHATGPRTIRMQIAAAFGASAITHPAVWYLIPLLPSSFNNPYHSWLEYLVRAELFAFVVEAVYFSMLDTFSLRRAFFWSFVANALSAGIGQLSRAYFHWP
ncbi:MAG: hypothetical protein IPK82_21930 [Polyangiaceae bacterium]|nr:hypothetical protein [Polyangiaceae bacterium]